MLNILISNGDCANPALGTFLLAAKRILQIIQIVGPIVLIISLIITLTKGTMNPEDKKINKKILNSIIAIFILFIIPVLINATMGVLGENFTVSECWNSIDNNTNNDNSEYKDSDNKKTPSKIRTGNGDETDYETGNPVENTESEDTTTSEQ